MLNSTFSFSKNCENDFLKSEVNISKNDVLNYIFLSFLYLSINSRCYWIRVSSPYILTLTYFTTFILQAQVLLLFLLAIKKIFPISIFELFILSSQVIWNTEIDSSSLHLIYCKDHLACNIPRAGDTFQQQDKCGTIFGDFLPVTSVFILLVKVQKCYRYP